MTSATPNLQLSVARGMAVFALVLGLAPGGAAAQQTAAPDGAQTVPADSGIASDQQPAPDGSTGQWSTMFDGSLFATFNRQGGRRGETDFRLQNWFMGMATRQLPRGTLTLSAGLSGEPFTVGAEGYSELFQVGEAYRGLQVTDRQHPHDLIMQAAAAWRVPLAGGVSLTLAGAPVGEPALGPAAFVHRASSSANPTAPLSHHVLDSTHIAHGVVLVGLDRGPFAIEGSVFRGREPDEHRYDLDLGELDSWSARLWFRPAAEWTFQGSYGYLEEPEQLEPGDQRRTNGSVFWLRQRGDDFWAVTAAVGQTERRFSTLRAWLIELTRQWGRTSVFSRFEDLTVETEILLFPHIVHRSHPGEFVDPLRQLTAGVVRDVATVGGFRVGVGGDVVLYGVPDLLQVTHERPTSFHLFLRLQPPARGGRMWNMTMGHPMHGAAGAHAGMVHEP